MGLKEELSKYTCSDIPQLCEETTERYSDLLRLLLLKLPPICEVLHEIPLNDESKQLKHRLPKCLLRTDPHGSPIQNWDVAGASKGDANIP